MPRIYFQLGFGLALVAIAVSTAHAQDAPRPARPYNGVFGGNAPAKTDQRLTVSANFGGGYDNNVLTGGIKDDAPSADKPYASQYEQMSGTLQYSVGRTHGGFNASVGGAGTYYQTGRKLVVPTYQGGVGGWFRLSRKARFNFGEVVSAQPLYYLSILPSISNSGPGQIILPDVSTGLHLENYFQIDGNASLGIDLSKRLGVSFGYNDQRTRSSSHSRDLSTRSGGATVRLGLTKDVGLRLGYYHTFAYLRSGDQTSNSPGDRLDAGLDFTRNFSLTRRLTLGFGSGVSALKDRSRTHYTAIGNVQLNREIARTWNAALTYNRDAQFVAVLQRPVYSDAIAAGVGGLLNRRLHFGTTLGLARGRVGFEKNENGFSTTYANASLTYGVGRNVGIGVTYSNYRSDFGPAVLLPEGLFSHVDRQSVRAFITLWAPLIQRTGKPDAAR